MKNKSCYYYYRLRIETCALVNTNRSWQQAFGRRSALYYRITACLQAYAEGETDRQTEGSRERGCRTTWLAGACDMLVRRETAATVLAGRNVSVCQRRSVASLQNQSQPPALQRCSDDSQSILQF